MKTDVQGCSTCPKGEERYEEYTSRIGRKPVTLVQYDYRTPSGELFSCVRKSLEECRNARDKWMSKKK